MNESYSLSIIFPVLNERKNLEKLIPEFNSYLSETIKNFEFIIVDDNSTDNTDVFVEELKLKNININYIKRTENNSLPLSILEGINNSKYSNISWLDADGSMHLEAFKTILHTHIQNPSEVVIGSRVISGGGYKGISNLENSNFLQSIFNVKKSQDSVLGMILSNLFNKLLSIFYKSGVKDITSGFIITNKKYIRKDSFLNCIYGEYFIYLIANFIDQNINIKEVGYICETRLFGESKTAPNILVLFKRGVPYIKAAIKCRRKIVNS